MEEARVSTTQAWGAGGGGGGISPEPVVFRRARNVVYLENFAVIVIHSILEVKKFWKKQDIKKEQKGLGRPNGPPPLQFLHKIGSYRPFYEIVHFGLRGYYVNNGLFSRILFLHKFLFCGQNIFVRFSARYGGYKKL